jgi:glycerol-3-phosphate O-acyltransferase
MKEYPNIIADIDEWPISQFYKDRDRVVKKLSKETFDYLSSHAVNQGELTAMVNQTIYAEKLRAKTEPFKVDPPKDYAYWKKMEADLSDDMLRGEESKHFVEDKLKRIINRYSEEITGNFVPKTFLFARKALTKFFSALYNPFYSKQGGLFWGDKESLLDKFRIEGPMDHIRDLFDKGTVLVLPTHFSNLDSILIGYGIEMLTGMPAYSYGAGLNLYDYEVMAYYMSRLGAYKVDRRKRNPIYAQAIKQFSTISIQEGLNSIFFPGGTRSRDGSIEKEIKLGLLSTLIDAQNEFYLRNYQKKIIIVPLVVSYHFVLEADSLIEQHLKRSGKENYLAKRKSKKNKMGTFKFLNRLIKSDSNVTLSFGAPIDIFGNLLDHEANSIKNDKNINIKEYFHDNNGVLNYDRQRNMVYTRHLADEIVKSYTRENVVLTSHLLSFTAFHMFKKKYASLDIFNLINLPLEYYSFTKDEMYDHIDKLRNRLIELELNGKLKLSPEIKNGNIESIVADALRNINVYHSNKPIDLKDDHFVSEDFRLLYYYSNRLDGYKLDRLIQVSSVKSLKVIQSLY